MNTTDIAKIISIVVLALLGLGSGILLSILALTATGTVNPALYVTLGSVLGSVVTFFAKASGVSDGASIVQNAVNSVAQPMQDAINATPPSQQSAAPKSVVSTTPSNG